MSGQAQGRTIMIIIVTTITTIIIQEKGGQEALLDVKRTLIHLTLFLGSKQDHHHTFFRLPFSPLVIVRKWLPEAERQSKELLLMVCPQK